jgi:hypothetical protein
MRTEKEIAERMKEMDGWVFIDSTRLKQVEILYRVLQPPHKPKKSKRTGEVKA